MLRHANRHRLATEIGGPGRRRRMMEGTQPSGEGEEPGGEIDTDQEEGAWRDRERAAS